MPGSRRELLKGGVALAALAALPPTLALATGEEPDALLPAGLARAIDAAAEAALRAGAAPGIAVQLALRGTTLLQRSYGSANLETGTPLAPGGIFRIGSLTKQFTAALILKLAEAGKLTLDDPVARHLDFFAAAPAFTLRELLHHTAGLYSDEGATAVPVQPQSQIMLARQISQQARLFDFDPGSAWHYSNANYIVLGAVIEAVVGKPLPEAAQELLFAPLGLRNTAFDDSATVVPGRVAGYSPVEGEAGRFRHPQAMEYSDAGGAGAMRSTTADLCAWQQALFSGKLIAPIWLKAMLMPGVLRDGRVSGSQRFSPEDAHYGAVQYGMGLLISPPDAPYASALHYGYINGYSACLERFVDLGLTTAILCNGDVGPALPFRAMRRAIAEQLLPGLRR